MYPFPGPPTLGSPNASMVIFVSAGVEAVQWQSRQSQVDDARSVSSMVFRRLLILVTRVVRSVVVLLDRAHSLGTRSSSVLLVYVRSRCCSRCVVSVAEDTVVSRGLEHVSIALRRKDAKSDVWQSERTR